MNPPQPRRLTPMTGHGTPAVPTTAPRSTVFSPPVSRVPSRVQQVQAQLRTPTGLRERGARDRAARAQQNTEFGARDAQPTQVRAQTRPQTTPSPLPLRSEQIKTEVIALRAEMNDKFDRMMIEMHRMHQEISRLRGETSDVAPDESLQSEDLPTDGPLAEAQAATVVDTSTPSVRQKIEAAVSGTPVDASDVRD